MRIKPRLFLGVTLFAFEMHSRASEDPATAFFETEIAPLLERRCYECHSHESGKSRGGLVLDSRSGRGKATPSLR
ncbi:MAG: hypothetical protein P1U87_21360 [Verrucomicrobiales bacterium]|nr:hypothetical protein [Verrucomicrobiales bacterium]